MNAIANLTPQQLRRAADIQERLLILQEELNEVLGGGTVTVARRTSTGKTRNMSAAGRAAISAAAKARWAKFRLTAPAKPVPTRKMSAAGRARLAAFARERWKKIKSQGKSRL